MIKDKRPDKLKNNRVFLYESLSRCSDMRQIMPRVQHPVVNHGMPLFQLTDDIDSLILKIAV